MSKSTAQRGFIFFELMIGLPLILALLWSMSHLFVGTWKTCRDLIADLTLQMEVHNAMQRIVSDLRVASHAKVTPNGRLQINSYLYKYVDGANDIIDESAVKHSNGNKWFPIFYFHAETVDAGDKYVAIYRQRADGEKNHPITGQDILSDVSVTDFKRTKEDTCLWIIEIEAQSRVSGHKFRLETKVYVGGADIADIADIDE